MTNQATIDKLIEMRLTTMADAFRSQTMDPSMKGIPFEDRFGLLVDVEYSSRKNSRLKRLIHNAEFDQPSASIADIDYSSEYSCAMKSHFRKSGNQMSGKWKSSCASLLA